MNTGLAILIARTKTHPEEFFGWETGSHIASKWVTAVENFNQHMNDEEKAAWEEAKKELDEWYLNRRRDDFTEFVMKQLAGVVDTDSVPSSKYSEQLAMSMKNTKEVLAAGLLKTFKAQYESEEFTNAFKVNE
jgi:hypothetical protein